jgi:hypothetical protein
VNKPPFISSYQGETDYRWKGERICVRYLAMPQVKYSFPYTFEEEILSRVGCVYRDNAWEGFPDPEVCEFFLGYEPARIVFVDDPTRHLGKRTVVEYLHAKPRVVYDLETGYIFSTPWWEESRRLWRPHLGREAA